MSQDDQKLFKMFCQACGAEFVFSASVAGRKARCLSCKHVFRVPTLATTDSPASPVGPPVLQVAPPDEPGPPVATPGPKPKPKSVDAPRPAAPQPKPPSAPDGRTGSGPAPRKRSHSVRLQREVKTPPAGDLLGNDDLLGVAPPAAPPPPIPTGVDDPLENLASLERRVVEEPVAGASHDQAIGDPRMSAGQSGPLLVLEGLMYLALIFVAVFLAVRFLGVVAATWVLLPVVAVFGRRLVSRVTFMMTMGTVRLR